MPKEIDLEAMPRRQQNIYIISDCNDNAPEFDDLCQNLIGNLIERFYGEAERHPDVAFHFCNAIYRDDHTFGISDLYTLKSDEPLNIPAAPSMESHEESFWNAFSKAIYDTHRRFRAERLTCYLPIYVFFINQDEHLEDAIKGREDLSVNNYFRIAVEENRRLVFCSDSVWANRYKQTYVRNETDRVIPFDVWNENILNLVLRIPQRQLQTGDERWYFKKMENEIVLGYGVYPEKANFPKGEVSPENIVSTVSTVSPEEIVSTEDTETVPGWDD